MLGEVKLSRLEGRYPAGEAGMIDGLLEMVSIDQCAIRYTAREGATPPDDPTSSAQQYAAPLSVSATTTFKAALACAGVHEREWLVSSLTFTNDDDAKVAMK